MKKYLQKLYNHQALTRNEAKEVLIAISKQQYTPVTIAAFLSAYNVKKIELHELQGFKDAMLELCTNVTLNPTDCIDVCGTGGDEKNTFNISTLTAFILAGAGQLVCKHGNYGVSSVSGSSNVLEYLGIQFPQDASEVQRQMDLVNIGFIHAPLFNKSMKEVAGIRKELGVKTFFNLLGPLCNPAQPKYQFIGVADLEVLRMYQYLLQDEDRDFSLVHTLSGYDEISLTDKFKVVSNKGEQLFDPKDFVDVTISEADLFGGNSVAESSIIFEQILKGNGTDAQNKVVLTNAAFALQATHPERTYAACYNIVEAALFNQDALQSFEKLRSIS